MAATDYKSVTSGNHTPHRFAVPLKRGIFLWKKNSLPPRGEEKGGGSGRGKEGAFPGENPIFPYAAFLINGIPKSSSTVVVRRRLKCWVRKDKISWFTNCGAFGPM